MPALIKKIELLANVAIILVAILLGIVLVRNFLIPRPAASPKERAQNRIQKGSKLSLPGFDWTKNRRNVVLALSDGCRFCTESAGFYQRLVNARERDDFRLIAVLPHPEAQSRKYLSTIGVRIDDVKQGEFRGLGIDATPTILLVDDEGEVAEAWVGKLPEDVEAKVLALLQNGASTGR